MNIKIKRLHKDAVIPAYSKIGDAGMDLTAVSKDIVDRKDHGYTSYGTGLAFQIPEGFVGLIFPRSSISNTGLLLSNSVGVVDSGYRGEVSARFKHIPGTKDYEVGDRVAQMLILPYPQVQFEEVKELETSERSSSGYGSTGK